MKNRFIAKKDNFDGMNGYMVYQIHNGRTVVEQFLPEDDYKEFCEKIGVEPEIISTINTMGKFTEHIRDILKERGNTDADIAAMTPDEAFREVLEWEGLIGYDGAIKRWIKDIYRIEIR